MKNIQRVLKHYNELCADRVAISEEVARMRKVLSRMETRLVNLKFEISQCELDLKELNDAEGK
jgi:hypothetical protein